MTWGIKCPHVRRSRSIGELKGKEERGDVFTVYSTWFVPRMRASWEWPKQVFRSIVSIVSIVSDWIASRHKNQKRRIKLLRRYFNFQPRHKTNYKHDHTFILKSSTFQTQKFHHSSAITCSLPLISFESLCALFRPFAISRITPFIN